MSSRSFLAVLTHFLIARRYLAAAATTTNSKRLPPLSYDPGNFANQTRSTDERVLLSNGLSAKPFAIAGEYVKLKDGTKSSLRFHKKPDAAAVFEVQDTGGWLYVSNAENENVGSNWDDGGVGAIEFDSNGEVVGYERIANYTTKNCGGGKTLWNTWISGEEAEDGLFIQVDPYGKKPMELLESLGSLGWYESFAYDNHTGMPVFYSTRDHKNGVVTRFTPDEQGYACYQQPNDYDRWCTLDNGTIDYLHLTDEGLAEFTDNYVARLSDNAHPKVEGIDIYNGILYFTAKVDRLLYVVDLLNLEYEYEYTSGFEPDQIVRAPDDDALYFCEDGGPSPGLHVRHGGAGKYTTILHLDENVIARSQGDTDETTGISFSPDAKHLYVAFQESGILYDVTRDDLRSFKDRALTHATSSACLMMPPIWVGIGLWVYHSLAHCFL